MGNTRRVKIDTDNDARRIDTGCVGQAGSGEVERRKNPVIQHEGVTLSAGVSPQPHNDTWRIVGSGKRERSARIINRGEGPAV